MGDINKTIALYLALMEEAKARALSINTLTSDQRGIPSPLIREYCFLQLRMLCEIIGLSCLVAHGDIEATNKNDLRKAYDPATILKLLEKLHSDFYPVPVRPLQTKGGWYFDNYIGGPYLKQEELPVLYGLCGDVLHKGSLKRLVSRRSPIQNNFNDVNSWGQKILNLLSVHRIISITGRKTLVAFLQVDDLGGAVQVIVGEAPELPPNGT